VAAQPTTRCLGMRTCEASAPLVTFLLIVGCTATALRAETPASLALQPAPVLEQPSPGLDAGRAPLTAFLRDTALIGFPSRVERTPPVCRSALYSPLLSPFGLESVTVFDPAPLCASPSQKPACGFPAQASSTSSSPNGVHGDQRPGTWEWMSRGIAPETFPRKTAPLAAMIEPFEQEFVDCSFKAVEGATVVGQSPARGRGACAQGAPGEATA
jgi:hypothetical protein